MPASTTLVPGKRLAEFDAVYHQGDTDYDEAFVVSGEAGAGYRGECGMGIASALDSDYPRRPPRWKLFQLSIRATFTR